MCGSKKGGSAAATPAQPVAAQPVSAAATIKSAVKQDDAMRGSNPDLRTDANAAQTQGDVVLPEVGDVKLGATKKRKGVVGLDL